VVAAPERLRNQQAFVLGPFECSFARDFPRLHGRLRKQALDVFPERAPGRRLQIISVRGQHLVKRVGSGENHFRDQSGMLLSKFRCEDVLEFVREFAQFPEAASGGIAFQGVNGATNTTEVFFIARLVFQRESGLIHCLENFRSALEEEIAELGSALVGEKCHWAPSTR
jgi:hypothetical protein